MDGIAPPFHDNNEQVGFGIQNSTKKHVLHFRAAIGSLGRGTPKITIRIDGKNMHPLLWMKP